MYPDTNSNKWFYRIKYSQIQYTTNLSFFDNIYRLLFEPNWFATYKTLLQLFNWSQIDKKKKKKWGLAVPCSGSTWLAC